MRRWDPVKAFEIIEREKAHVTGGVPTIAWQLIEHPAREKYDLSSIESMAYGGAHLRTAAARLTDLLLGMALASLYIVYAAPVLFAELLLDGALEAQQRRHLRRGDHADFHRPSRVRGGDEPKTCHAQRTCGGCPPKQRAAGQSFLFNRLHGYPP